MIFPKYPQDIHKIFPFSIGKSSEVLDLLALCSSPLFVRELFTAVCHSPTISFREHLATAICNPAESASFCYSDFLHSNTFEENRLLMADIRTNIYGVMVIMDQCCENKGRKKLASVVSTFLCVWYVLLCLPGWVGPSLPHQPYPPYPPLVSHHLHLARTSLGCGNTLLIVLMKR